MTRPNAMAPWSVPIRWCVLGLIAAAVSPATADVRLPNVFGTSMILQRGLETPVSGMGRSGRKGFGQLCRPGA